MTEIQKALLGNKDAAKRLTDVGVLVPCPFCGGEATEVSGVVFVVSVSDVAIVSPSINGCSDLDFILGDFVEETASSFSGDFSGYPLSDCYKSHEDAKAALRREQNG